MELDDDFEIQELDNVNMDFESIRDAVIEVIKGVGEDPEREGLKNTPDRVSRMYAELLSGYSADPEKIINGALFHIDYDEMVLVRTSSFIVYVSIICCPFSVAPMWLIFRPGK